MQIGSVLNSSLARVSNPYEMTSAYSTLEPTKQPEETDESKDSKEDTNKDELTSAQKALVQKLQITDQKVKEHEAAHISVGGSVITSGANFSYTQGPDKRLYATSGEVGIDTSPESTPRETIPKMQLVRAAALAPSDPSGTDYQVASTATLLEMQARFQLSVEIKEELAQKNVTQYINNTEESSDFKAYA